MPKNLTPAGGWAENVAVPVDADPRDAESVEVPFQALTDRTQYLRNQLEQDSASVVHIDPFAGQSGGWASGGIISGVESTGILARLFFDLAAYLPDGARVLDIELMATEGAGRPLGSRLNLGLARKTVDWSTPADVPEVALGYSESGGGSGFRVIALSDGVNWGGSAWAPITINKAQNAYTLRVTAGVDGGAHAPDTVHAIRVLYEAPEARR